MSGGARKGAGRPPGTRKPDSRNLHVKVRVSGKEKAEIQRRASLGNQSVSEFILVCCLSGKGENNGTN